MANISIEEAEDLSTNVSVSGFLVGEDALVGWDDQMTELSWGQDVAGPLLEVLEGQIVSRTDNTALVNSADQLNDDLLWSVVVNDLELSDVAVHLHEFKELDDQFRDGSDEDLLLSFSFSVDDGSETVRQNIHFDHWSDIKIII